MLKKAKKVPRIAKNSVFSTFFLILHLILPYVWNLPNLVIRLQKMQFSLFRALKNAKKPPKIVIKYIFGKIFFFSSIHYKIIFHLICHMVHVVKSPKLAIFVLNKWFFFKKNWKKKLKNRKKSFFLDILETRLVSKFGMIRLKITLFSKEKHYF